MLTAERSLTDMDGYLSPEQANGRPLDGRSDIFSLRVVMYDALSGRHANLVCTRSGSSEPAKRGRGGDGRERYRVEVRAIHVHVAIPMSGDPDVARSPSMIRTVRTRPMPVATPISPATPRAMLHTTC